MIDSLSLDILHEDLSHLTGESIYLALKAKSSDFASTGYLLDILKCIHEWISSKPNANSNSIVSVSSSASHSADKLLNLNDSKQIESNIEPIAFQRQQQQEKEQSKKDLECQDLERNLQRGIEIKQEEEIIFKEYMQQKEKEFEFNKLNQLTETSNGNISMDNSLDISDHLIKQVNNPHYTPGFSHNHRYVTFNNIRHSVGQPPIASIQTVDNELKKIKQSLRLKLLNDQSKIKTVLNNVYDDDLKDAKSIMRQSLEKYKNKSNLTNQLYMSAFNTARLPLSSERSSLSVTRSSRSKGVLMERYKAVQPSFNKKPSRALIRSQSVGVGSSRYTIGEDGLLGSLLQEFPYLYTSPETIHYLWEKHSKQIETFSKLHKEIENKYLRSDSETSTKLTQHHLEESYKKQELLMDIMRKDLQHLQRVQDMKRKTEVENSMKSRQREQRFQTAKVKRYYEEFRLQHRAKMLKKTTSEELIFKKLFNESLKLQKERLFELKRYAKEKSEINTKAQLNQIESIENFYKNKFDLLNEQLNRDKQDTLVRERAQHVILNKMKKNVRKKLETDIRDLQDQMAQDKDSVHWREMDAKRIQMELYSASYYKPNSSKKK